MVARKSPLGQRLDNAHRGYGSRMFRREGIELGSKRMSPSVNESNSRDWLGWTYSYGESASSYDYGRMMNLGRDVVSYVTLAVEEKKLMVNRCPMTWDGSSVTVRVEFVSPRGRCIRAKVLRDLKVEMARVRSELELLYRGKGMVGLKIRLLLVPLLNIFVRHLEWKRELDKLVRGSKKGSGSRLYSGKDPRRLVTAKGVRSVLMLASFWPVAPVLCKMISHRLERTMKHGEVVSDIRSKLGQVSKSKEFGLLNHTSVSGEKRRESMAAGELGAAYGLRLRGGYRGYVVTVSGTLDGARRTYKEEVKAGVIPLSSVSLPVSHASGVAKTKIGTRGVQVTYSY